MLWYWRYGWNTPTLPSLFTPVLHWVTVGNHWDIFGMFGELITADCPLNGFFTAACYTQYVVANLDFRRLILQVADKLSWGVYPEYWLEIVGKFPTARAMLLMLLTGICCIEVKRWGTEKLQHTGVLVATVTAGLKNDDYCFRTVQHYLK